MTSLRACPFPRGRPCPRPRTLPVAGGLLDASVAGGIVVSSVEIDEDGIVDASGHEDITSGVLMEDWNYVFFCLFGLFGFVSSSSYNVK